MGGSVPAAPQRFAVRFRERGSGLAGEQLGYGIMIASTAADIQALEDAFNAAERDARALVAGLGEDRGAWRAATGSWSVAECLDHLATANRVYLRAMRPRAERALAQGRRRRGPAQPGLIGRWFVGTLEPPAR